MVWWKWYFVKATSFDFLPSQRGVYGAGGPGDQDLLITFFHVIFGDFLPLVSLFMANYLFHGNFGAFLAVWRARPHFLKVGLDPSLLCRIL